MDQQERNKILSNLYVQANENNASLFSEMVSLLSDMEARISILESKAELPVPPVPLFVVPACVLKVAHSLPPNKKDRPGPDK
jgi:hypothetical protein